MLAEEFPIEEFEGLPDWNATAWFCILLRDAKRLQPRGRGEFLAARTQRDLLGMRGELLQDEPDAELLQAIETELAQRAGSE